MQAVPLLSPLSWPTMRQVDTSLLDMARIALIVGLILLLSSGAFLIKGVMRMMRGESIFGKGGSSIYTLLGFALFAMGSLLFLFGVFRFSV
jgi:hypothetical protein